MSQAVDEFIQNGKDAIADAQNLGDAFGYKAPKPTPVQPSPYLTTGTNFTPYLLAGAALLVALLVWKKLR